MNITNKLENYKHWTLKEIEEQNLSSLRAINIGGRLLNNDSVKLVDYQNTKII